MADSIDALKDRLFRGRGLDESALTALEALCAEGDHTDLPELFRTYQGLAGRATEAKSLQRLAMRLVDLLDGLIAGSPEPAFRGPLQGRRALILDVLGSRDEASKALAGAFSDLPDESLLERMAERVGLDDATPLGGEVLSLRIALAVEPERRLDAIRRLAGVRLVEQRLDEAAALFQRVRELAPEDPVAAEGLASLEATRAAQAEMLEVLRQEAVEARGGARVEAALAYAEALTEYAGDPPAAIAALTEAVRIDPAHAEASERLVALLAESDELDTLETVGKTWVQASDGEAEIEAQKAVGMALFTAGRVSAAGPYLEAAVVKRSADPALVAAAVDARVAGGDPSGAIAVLHEARRKGASRADERRWLLREAELVWRELGDMDAAEKLFRRLRASDPRDETALAFYEDHLTQKEDWKRLLSILSQKFSMAEGERRVEVAERMAHVAEVRMGNLPKAIDAYKRVLHADPQNERATDQLIALYEKTGKWHALIEFLNGQIRRLGSQEADRKVALLFQIIGVYQDPTRMPVEEMVIHTYNRIVQLSPTNLTALDNLARRYEDGRRWSELVAVLRRKIEATDDPEELLDLFHQVADLYLSKMSSETHAVPFLERILELDPTNLEVVHKLRRIYKAKHNLERLYATYEAELNVLEGGERVPVLTEMAVLATDKLAWHDAAISHWEELLEYSPGLPRATRALARLYAQEGRWGGYAGLLEHRLPLARTRRERQDILEKLGQIRNEKLGQVDQAVAAYREVLALSPHHTGARNALQRLYVAAKNWEALKALYAERSDWKGYARFLSGTLNNENDPLLRKDITFELVEVLEHRLADPAAAVSQLELLLADDAENIEVAAALDARYARLGTAAPRIKVLGILAEFSEAPAEALSTGVSILGELGRHDEAFEWAQRRAELALDEGRVDGLSALWQAADAADAWEELAIWYGEAADRVGGLDHSQSPEERRELLTRQAVLLRDRLRQNAAALAVFETLSHMDGADWDSLRELEDLTRLERDWQALQRVLERQIAFLNAEGRDESAPECRLRRLQLGELYEDILDDPDAAVAQYQAVLAAGPGDPQAVAGLDRVYQLEDRWDDLLALLSAQLEATEDSRNRVGLLARMAQVFHEQKGQPDAAMEALERALALDAHDLEAMSALDALFDDGFDRARVAPLLAAALRHHERWARLLEVLADSLTRTKTQAERRAVLADMAGIRETRLDDPEGALALVAERVALDPRDAAGRAELERLAATLDQWEVAAGLYEACLGVAEKEAPFGLQEWVRRVQDIETEVDLARRLAEIFEIHLDAVDKAIACNERVWRLVPDDLEAVAGLERLLAHQEDWEGLIVTWTAKLELVDSPQEKKELHVIMAGLLADLLERPEDAVDAYRAALAIDGTDLEVVGELEALYSAAARWADLADLLEHKISLLDGAGRVEALFELAVVCRDGAQDVGQAVEVFARLLDQNAEHLETIAALEALLLRRDLVGFESFAPRAAALLQPWLSARGHWEREIAVLEVCADLADDDAARAVFQCEMGALLEGPGAQLEAALGAYAEAFGLDPASALAELSLQRVAGMLEAWGPWADALEQGIRDDEPEVAAPLLMKLGAIVRGQLQDQARAVETYERLLRVAPTHQGALRALDDLFGETGDLERRVEVLERRAETSASAADQAALLFEVGVINQGLGQVEAAIAAFDEVTRRGSPAIPPASDALDRLQALYSADERWMSLVEVLLLKASGAEGLDDRKKWTMAAAAVQEQRLENVGEAIRLFERVHTDDPDDGLAFQNLARLLHGEGRLTELEDLYLEVRARTEDVEAANGLDFRLAQLYEHRLGRVDEALDRYEAILERSPAFAPALTALTAAMESEDAGLRASTLLVLALLEMDDVDRLVPVLQARLERWPDGIDVLATRRQLATLMEQRLGDPGGAFQVLCDAAQAHWADPGLRGELCRLAQVTGDWEGLEAVDRAELARHDVPQEAVAVLAEMARVATEIRGDPDSTEVLWWEILAQDPEHTGALDALLALFEAQERPDDRVEILGRKAELASPAEQVALYYQMGGIQRGELNDVSAAIASYEAVLAVAPREQDAYRQLEAIHGLREDWEAVAALLEREIGALKAPAEVLETRRRRAMMLLEQVGDRARALDAADTLLEGRSDDPVALAIYERCHAEGSAYERTLARLAPLYEAASAWDALIALYARHVERGDVAAQVWALGHIRDIQEGPLRDRAAAMDTLTAIVRLEPVEKSRWAELEGMAKRQSRQRALADFYLEVLDDAEDDSEYLVPLALRTARMLMNPLKDLDGAALAYRIVLATEPANTTAIAALSRLFETHERWAELVDLQAHAAAVAETAADRQRLLTSQARNYEQRLDQPGAAADVLLEVLDEAPDNRDAFRRLERLLGGLARWDDLEQLYRRWLQVAEAGEEVTGVRYRLAGLYDDERGELERAVDELAMLIGAREGSPHRPTVERLESILERAEDVALKARVADLLERVYGDRTAWEKWASVHRAQLAAAGDTETRMLLHNQLGTLLRERAGAPELAFVEYQRAFELDFGNADIEPVLESIAAERGLQADLVAVYSAGLDDLELEAQAHYLQRMAELKAGPLRDPEGAAGDWEQILEIDPTHEAALDALEAYYQRAEAPTDLIRVLRLRQAATADGAAQVALLYRIADRQLRELRDEAAAIDAYREILELDRAEVAAKNQLQRLYKAHEDWPALVEVYRAKLDFADDPDDQIDFLSRIAQLQEKRIGALPEAVEAYADILERSPQNVLAITSLKRLYPEVEAWESLLDVLERERSLYRSPRDRAKVDMEIGVLLLERLGRPEPALDRFRVVLGQQPGHAGVIERLETMLDMPTVRLAASFALEPNYEEAQAHHKLGRLLEVQLDETDDSLEQIELLKRLAEIRDRHEDDPDGAMAALGRAFQLDPQDEQLRETLGQVAERSERWEALADVYQAALGRVADIDVQREVSEWLAELYEQRLDDPEAAIERYREVLALDEFNRGAADHLSALLEGQGGWAELADLLRSRLSQDSGASADGTRERLAALLLGRLDDPDAALELYKEILWEDPNASVALEAMGVIAARHPFLRREVIRLLAPIHQAADRWEEMVALLLLGVDEDASAAENTRTFVRVAELCEVKLGDPERALGHYRQALANDPADGGILGQVERLAGALSRWAELAETVEGLLGSAEGAGWRVKLLLKAATIAGAHLNDAAGAEARLRDVLELEPENYEALAALREIYASQGRMRDLIAVCEAMARQPIETEERVSLLRQVAKAAHYRQDEDKAEQAWGQLLELRGRDLEALEALEALYRGREDFARLAETMERRASALEPGADLMALKVELGRLRAAHLGDLRGAVYAYEEALEWDESNRPALAALDELLERLGEPEERAIVLERRIALAEGPAEQTALLMQLAALEEQALHRVDSAIVHYQQILAIEPGHEATVDELIRLFHKHERWEGLADAYERKLALVSAEGVAMALKVRAAELYAERLDDKPRALALVEEVLAVAPEQSSAMRLAAILRAEADPEAAIETYERLLPTLKAAADQIGAYLVLGKLYLETQGNTTRALSCFREVLQLDPEHQEANRLIKAALYRRESWEALVPVLEREFGRTISGRERSAVALELALLHRDRLGSPDEALRWLETGYQARRDDPHIVEALIDYHCERDNWKTAAPLLAWQVSYLEAKRRYDELAGQAHRLGRLFERLADRKRALQYYKVANQYDSRNVKNVLAYGRLLLEVGKSERALDTLQGLLLLQHDIADPADKVAMFLYLAKACMANGDASKAKRHLKRLMRLEPRHPEAVALLQALAQ